MTDRAPHAIACAIAIGLTGIPLRVATWAMTGEITPLRGPRARIGGLRRNGRRSAELPYRATDPAAENRARTSTIFGRGEGVIHFHPVRSM